MEAARNQWTYTGAERPPFAIEPGPGQESVWDYPRPPAIAPDGRLIEVVGERGPIASSRASIRIMETSLPPSFYLPPDSIAEGSLVVVDGRSHCEWKGDAEYLAEPGGDAVVGWRYPEPYPEFAEYAGWVSFYPARVECRVDGERARPQNSEFYGGWITDELVGPFKGDPGVPAL
ncbi:MAG: DUF427 domain-containing protein [Acidimicrobiales bacterium]|nr:DUF427 domain-containing protein [Acidimicrobiales bacterium]